MSPGGKKPAGKNALTYRDAGVDIDAGEALVEAIKPLARSTNRPGIMGGLGGFGALFDLKAAGFSDPILVSGTDGVGTKLKIAIEANRHDTIGIDLVAMCVNDIVVQGAAPLFFLDYYATGKLDVAAGRAIVAGIAEGCRQAGCALTGGETAEMPGLYKEGDYDLAGFAVGAVERGGLLPLPDVKAGDVLLGLASSGVHSNGYSLVRKIVELSGLGWDAPAPFDWRPAGTPWSKPGAKKAALAEALLAPTRIYVRQCLAAIANGGVKALAHITGGGLIENIPRVLPEGCEAILRGGSWIMPPVFDWLRRTGGVPDLEMARTFNCGIGMVVACAAEDKDKVAAALREAGESVAEIGRIAAHKGEPRCRIDDPAAMWR